MTTTNLGMTVPTVGADTDNWGNDLNTDLGLIDAFAGKLMGAPEAVLASAATTDIGNAVSTAVAISGTTTITSFGTVANCIRFVRFTGALTLTYNATSLILLGGASRTTVAGACGIYRSDSSGNWRELAYLDQDVSSGANAKLGTLNIGGATLGSNKLAVNGSASINGIYIGNGISFSGVSINPDSGSGSSLVMTGFGNTLDLNFGSINTTYGSFQIQSGGAGGVVLNYQATSWASASSRSLKTNIQPIADALATVKKMQAALGLYKSDAPSRQLRPFLFFEDALENFPYITSYRPAHTRQGKDADGNDVSNHVPEHKGIMYETAVPLLFAAIQELSAQVDDLKAAKG